jgi:hypothetical protein
MSKKAVRHILLGSVATALVVAAVAFALSASGSRTASAAHQEIDPSYANDTVVYMIGPHLNTNPSPQLLATSANLYIAAYPWDLANPPVFASGYQPQCDPCYHPGLPVPFVYHDHILSGAPGFGNDGTAGTFKGPWKVIVMLYNPSVESNPSFKPLRDDESIDAAEAAGEFLPINSDLSHGPNPYEFVTGNVLICPLVSPHA